MSQEMVEMRQRGKFSSTAWFLARGTGGFREHGRLGREGHDREGGLPSSIML